LGAAVVLVFAAFNAAAETIIVSAASSLGAAFSEIAALYESKHPADTVQLNLGGSGALLQQIINGAPVHVFASADEYTMDRAAQAGVLIAGTRQIFATNTLVLIQPAAAAEISTLTDLISPAVQRVAVGNPETVPVGRYARQALSEAGLWTALQGKLIQGQNVRQVLDYVARGEVDAGIVYGTDAALVQTKVNVVMDDLLPQAVRASAAQVQHSRGSVAARRFVDLLLSQQGQAVLQRHGFGAAPQ